MDMNEVLEGASRASRMIPDGWLRCAPAHQLGWLRLHRGVSQLQLADAAGLTASAVNRVEAGSDARLSTWLRLFSALGVEPVFLPFPTCEEATDLLLEERHRRRERRLAGLCAGKRRFG